MKISLLEVRSKGLRCPDYNLDLIKNGQKKISLIQMPNGVGKTTTLNLFRSCFYDKKWNQNEIKSLQRRGEINKKGSFVLKISLDKEIYWIELNFDFEKNSVKYFTTGSEGKKEGFHLPDQIVNIVDENFINLLFFDLEFAKALFRNNDTRAGDSIYAFCRLGIVKKLQNYIDEYYSEQQRKYTVTPSQIKQIEAFESTEKILKFKIKDLEGKISKNKIKLTEKRKEFNELDTEIKKFIDSTKNKKEKIKKAENNKNKGRDNIINKLKENMHAYKSHLPCLNKDIRKNVYNFIDSLYTLKLPEAEARAFFEELLRGNECICGEHLTEDKKELINDKKSIFLNENTAGAMNSYKTAINDLRDQTFDLNDTNSEIINMQAFYDASIQTYNEVYDKELGEDPEIHKKRNRADKLKEEILDIEKFIKDSDKPWSANDKPDTTESLVSLNKQLDYIEAKLAKAKKIESLLFKKQKINSLLSQSVNHTKIRLSKDLTKECNEKIKIMLPRDPLFLEDIKDTLILKDSLTEEDEGSVGQMARIGYVFLTSLLNKSSHLFPLIVDSPVTGMDDEGRRETAKLICNLDNQYIGFVLNTEKEYFIDSLEEDNSNNIFYATIYRHTKNTEKFDANLPSSAVKTKNGVLVYDKDFFDKFSFIGNFKSEEN